MKRESVIMQWSPKWKEFERLLVVTFLIILLGSHIVSAAVSCSLNDGMEADGKTAIEYHGVKHQFCCSGCLDRFKENPENFSKAVQQPLMTDAKDAQAACSSVCGGT